MLYNYSVPTNVVSNQLLGLRAENLLSTWNPCILVVLNATEPVVAMLPSVEIAALYVSDYGREASQYEARALQPISESVWILFQ